MKRLRAITCAGALTLAGCGAEEVVERAPVVRPVKTIVVGGLQQQSMSFPGTVQGSERAELSFRVAGPLIELPVDEGDEVPRGRLLARIDPRDFEIAIAEAQAGFDKAEADYARYKNLYERNAVPLAELELRRAARDVAAASLDQAQANLRDTRLTAPFAGFIGRKYVENFEDVVAKQSILTLNRLDTVEVVIDLPERFMASVQEEKIARFTAAFGAAPGFEFDMSLREFASEADPQTQTFRVTFSMRQPEELAVLPGMTANVNAYGMGPDEAAPLAAEFVIPAEAVFASPGGDPRVWVVETGALTVHARDVRVGPVEGANSILVLEGLERGETIAVAAVHQLQDGAQIRLMESRN